MEQPVGSEPVATATVVVPAAKSESPQDRFVTAPGKHTTEWKAMLLGVLMEVGAQAVQVVMNEDIDTSGGWIAIVAYITGRTLVKVAEGLRKSATVVVAKK